MKKLLLAGGALAALVAGPAMAADTAAPAYKAPPPVHIYSWTGCYIGANAGWIGGGDRLTNYPGPGLALPVTLSSSDVHALTNDVVPRGSGFAGGGQAGCN